MYYGVQYYPEHWPQERWKVDAEMMQRAGVNTVRMGEFAWSALEPQPGRYDFEWMAEAIDLLYWHGISTILCTPSRTPPPWVFQQHPGVINTRFDGVQNRYGQRYTVGHAHPEFIELSQRIDRAVIERFAGNPAITGWQIDNEVGSFNDCFCGRCRRIFQQYLREKYGSVKNLNDSWGRHFWSFTFTDFSEVPLPANNPQLGLEYRRFLSNLNVEFSRWRADLIRQLDPGKFVTTNFQSAHARHTDYFQEAEFLDMNGMNYYPPRMPEFMQDYYRSGKSLIVLEQMSRLQPFDSGPGWMRLWAYRSLGHGALGTIFFRWRTCRWGQEQFADGILSHDGVENRRYGELAQMGAEMKQVSDLIDGTSVPSEAAIALSYESRWAMEQERFGPEMDGLADAVRFHEAFLDANTPVDGLDPRADLSRYKLVIASRLFLVDEAIAANLADFVEAGGTLCLTAGSGAVDSCSVGFDTPRPGPLAAMAGVTVSDLSPLHDPVPLRSEAVPGLSGGQAHTLSDEMHPKGAKVVATYAAGWRDGLPALTVNEYGKGKVFYLGTALDEKATAAILDYLFKQSNVRVGPQTPEGVRAHERRGAERRLLFLLNYTDSAQTVTLAERWTDAFDGEAGESFEVPPVGLRLLQQNL